MNRVPQEVIDQDHEIESAASAASEALAQLRWHWTLDESNPDRVSIKEYARSIGRAFTTVHGYVNGYALRLADRDIPIAEAIDRAGMGAETQAVTEAVAEARGLSFTHTRQTRGREIRFVREAARDAAERKGTTVAEEAVRFAQFSVKAQENRREHEDERAARHTLRWVEAQGYLDRAAAELRKAVTVSASWDDEERALLLASVENIRRIINLLDARIVGKQTIDWEAEIDAIFSERAS